ncbi:uncharacterized protein LOC110412469 [Herrania umbratica]|uniref:Uncharacterized protein LOC110412469 n=1 Tax=Herrania umbratica TaxID=108875 RepID=A0A6J0ZV35_9ROSI|nr:uncharacterized protein LOC110412469 [Herrania umbratica]
MEYTTTKPSKPSSNISELVSKFARVCKLRSMGVLSAENTLNSSNINAPLGEDSSDNTEETECDSDKIHPRRADVSCERNICGEAEVLKLFDTVSALKSAYLQLQKAHIPYDPDKIIAADELVLSKLETLCKIKRAYKEKQFTKSKLDSSCLELLLSEVKVNERLLKKLKSENKTKDSEIVRLKQKLQALAFRNAKLVEIIRRERVEREKTTVLDVTMFQNSFKAASKSIHDFAKPLISLMMASGWDLDLAVKSIDDGVAYSRKRHKKYAFEAYIAWRMFHGMLLESYNCNDIMKFDDPIDALIENPDSGFAKFCRKKYLLVVHPMMEMSFFGNLDQRNFISSGKHPRTPFYQVFVKMAKWIWILHGIACSIDPEAKIFVVKRGSQFSDVYMESIEQDREGLVGSDEGQATQKVELMVMPGFRVGETVVRSRVYLSKTN